MAQFGVITKERHKSENRLFWESSQLFTLSDSNEQAKAEMHNVDMKYNNAYSTALYNQEINQEYEGLSMTTNDT